MYLEHANITVSDLEKAVEFLSTAFPDFVIRGRGIATTAGNERPWLHIGNQKTYLALEEATAGNSGHKTYRNPGFNHVGFVVDDIEGLIARLSDAGYTENMRDFSHAHRKRIYFYDDDGNEYEFVEYLTTDPDEMNQY